LARHSIDRNLTEHAARRPEITKVTNFPVLGRSFLYSRFWLGQQGFWIFLLLMFVAQMLGSTLDFPLLRLSASLFLSLFLISGVRSLSPRRSVRAVGCLLVMAAIVLRWLGHALPTPAIIGWGLATALLVMIALTLVSIDKVFRDDSPVTAARVMGAVAVYLLFGMAWSFLYGLLDLLLHDAFNLSAALDIGDPDRLESFTYFSFVTLTTLGYGDITPVHQVARLFVIIQALFGQLYPATLLARLVSLEITSRQSNRPPTIGEP